MFSRRLNIASYNLYICYRREEAEDYGERGQWANPGTGLEESSDKSGRQRKVTLTGHRGTDVETVMLSVRRNAGDSIYEPLGVLSSKTRKQISEAYWFKNRKSKYK